MLKSVAKLTSFRYTQRVSVDTFGMRETKLFTRARREAPKDEAAVNAALLIRAGFVEKLMAGVYSFLPLGLRVMERIARLIRDEMNALGGQEIIMPALQPKENWLKTGRWETYDALFRFTSHYGKSDYALGPTHEEVVVPLVQHQNLSYKDFPFAVYQIQNKFRDEPRAKSGLLRSREFLMKDLYSFHLTEADLDAYYERIKEAYTRIFEKAGIGSNTYLTFASGGTFSQYSHEFQTVTDAGEDVIFLCPKCSVAVNREIVEGVAQCPLCGSKKLTEHRAIEVGNIFKLKAKYSSAFDFRVKDETGKEQEVLMGCYGIGLSRLMGTIVETRSDGKGIVWPESIAPFQVHLLALGETRGVASFADKAYDELHKAGVDVLYDDRAASAGEKFADADLKGIPWRAVVSEKTVREKKIELKRRDEEKTMLVSVSELKKRFA